MGKSNATVSDAQLKGRRTSLEKKNYEELVDIILRKDSVERKLNAKVQELTTLLKEANDLNETNTNIIMDLTKDKDDMEEIIKVKQEQLDSIISEKHILEDEKNTYCKKYVLLKKRAILRKKVIFGLCGMITILFILIFMII